MKFPGKFITPPLLFFLFWGIPSPFAFGLTLVQRNPNPVFSTGEPHPWDREEVEGSSVIHENGKFRMWYTGFDGRIYRIGLAVSEDGIAWKKRPGFVLGPKFEEEEEGLGVGHPFVMRDGDSYKMWFVASHRERSMIGFATSADGISWEKDVSVLNPDAYYLWTVKEMYYPCVLKEGETYRMYFVGYDGSSYSIGMALSEDGIRWKPHADAPILAVRNGGYGRKAGISHPFVRKNESGKYEMWFSEMKDENWSIRHALSADGVRWERTGEEPLVHRGKSGHWDAVSAYKPIVHFQNEKYTMWYSGSDGYRVRTGMLTSLDGKKWTKFAGNPVIHVGEGKGWENASLNGGTLLKDGALYKIWYSGYNGSKIRVGYAVSTDGFHWEKSHDNPVLDTGSGGEWDRMGVAYPSVLMGEDGVYRMWYLGYDGAKTSIGAASSRDGIHWEKDENNPVFLPGREGEWDGESIARVSVLLENGIYKMWYSGSDSKTTRIGLATSKDGLRWKREEGNPVFKEGKEGEGDHLSVSFPHVLREGKDYRLWYSGLGEEGYRIFEARSGDGVRWERINKGKPALDIPKGWDLREVKSAMVCKERGGYLMAFEELDSNTNMIALAKSEDGARWTRYGVSYVLDVGVGDGWDSYGVSGGWIMKDPATDGYRMWYSGHDGKTFRIGTASSADGLHWERYGRNPVLDKGPLGTWDSERVAYPSIIFDEGVYKMWYHGYGLNTSPSVGFAVSRDGVHWEKSKKGSVLTPGSGSDWDSFAVGYPRVCKDGDLYRMWYAGLDRNYGTWRIGYADSKDGLLWEKHKEGPVLDVGSQGDWDVDSVSYPMAIKTESGFLMFYIGYQDQTFRMGVANSEDGIQWNKESNNPLIDVGGAGDFDEGSVLSPMVIREGGKYRIWYTGIKEGQYKIGYAEAMEGKAMAGMILK